MVMSPRRPAVLLAPLVLVAPIAGCSGGSDSDGTGMTVAQPPGSEDLYVVERQGSVRIVRGGRV